MSRPELSVVIPTKNRARYCKSAVEGVLAFAGSLEVIVQDSSSDRETESSLEQIADPRLRYLRVSPTLNMTQNFESSIERASGEYIVMIGDDDGLSPWIWDCIAIARQHDADSLVTRKISLHYYWPDFTSKYKGAALAAKLIVEGLPYSGVIEAVDLEAARRKFLDEAGQGSMNLPRVYHGLVRRDLLDTMRTQFGGRFFGVSPDVSFSYTAACVSRKHLCVDYPVSISGSGANSNAGRSARREHKGDLETDPMLQNYRPLYWQDEVPRFFSVETVWAQASLVALEVAHGDNEAGYSFGKLYALCLLRHWDRRRETWRAIQARLRRSGELGFGLSMQIGSAIVATLAHDCVRVVSFVKARTRRAVTAVGSIHTAQNIAEAMAYLRQLKAERE